MEQKSLFTKEQVEKIAGDRGKRGEVKLLSVNQFRKGTEIWESNTGDRIWIMKFNYSQNAFNSLERARKLYDLLTPKISRFGVSLPSPEVFKVDNFSAKNGECWCSLMRKFEGEELEDVCNNLDKEKKEIYGTLGKIIAEIGKIKFHSFGNLDSRLRVIEPSTWKEYIIKRLKANTGIWEKYLSETDLIGRIKEKFEKTAYPRATPCCVIDDFNKGSVLLTQNKRYKLSSIIDLDESLSGHPEYGLSRALAYLTSKTDPAFPDYGDEYRFLIKGYEEQAGKLQTGFNERHLLNLLFFNVAWVAQELELGFFKKQKIKKIEQLLDKLPI